MIFALIYTLTVHVLDLLASTHPQFHFFQWQSSSGFDYYKFIFWFIVPFLLSLKNIRKNYFSFTSLKKIDVYLLLGLFILGGLAVSLVPFIEELKSYYLVETPLSTKEKFELLSYQSFWIISWLVGWEFLHRYYLVTRLHPKQALIIIPIIESLYHITKPTLEMMAMFFFSWLLTYWTTKRQNWLLPFIAHLFVEIALVTLVLMKA